MSSENSTRRRRDEVYKGLKTSLEVLVVAAKISPIPGLEGIITTVKGVMDIVEVNLCLSLAETSSDRLIRGRNTISKRVTTSVLKSTSSLILSMRSSMYTMILILIRAQGCV